MKTRLIGLGVALGLAAGATTAVAQGTNTSLTLTRDGVPAANVQVQVQPRNGSSTTVGTTGLEGELQIALTFINKNARYQLVVRECKNGEYDAILAEAGAEIPSKEDCRQFILGTFNARTVNAIRGDVTQKTFNTTGQSFIGTTRGRAILGGAAAVGIGALLVTGDSNNSTTGNTPAVFNPSGTYLVTLTVLSDPGENHEVVRLPASTQFVIQITGSTALVTPQAGANLPQMSGSHTAGEIRVEGRATVVVHPNVPHQLVAAVVMSGSNQGDISGQVTVGSDGQLRAGQAIVYRVAGRKQ